eukprot:TRINITY_DN7690_c0_g1_i1.p1 TRINITY_DN7690_c0_g1~~TRINITY_DN7690_c0_g1_i1.p1  ORF type:complete len:377 (+),score=61.95 TRINITY_DN7690_c0_g1_i1:53-1183(+)
MHSLFVLFLLAFFPLSLAAPQFGLYHGPAPYSPENFPAYEQWIGRPISFGTDFMPSDNWASLEGGGWQLGPWSNWVNGAPAGERTFVLSIPMVPSGQSAEIVNGAKGLHNSTFLTLAKNLVSYKLETTVLRIGWEFNGGWYPWSASVNPTAWVKYFQTIVEVMKSVNPKFRVLWNPSIGWGQEPAPSVYPGNEYVDFIGLDTYDDDWNSAIRSYNLGLTQRGSWNEKQQYHENDLVDFEKGYWKSLKNQTGVTPVNGTDWILVVNPDDLQKDREKAWNDFYSGSYGIQFWISYTKKQGKPLVFPEWGVWLQLHGGGDNPYYIQQMYNIINDESNNIAYYSYFDVYAFDGDHHLFPTPGVLPTLPLSAAKFKELFGK